MKKESFQNIARCCVILIATLTVSSAWGAAQISGPKEIAEGAYLTVEWQGTANEHDFIVVVPAGTPKDSKTWPLAYGYVKESSQVQIKLENNINSGDYELRYVTGGLQGEVLSSQPIRIVAAKASLNAPKQVSPGASFNVEWSGPNSYKDYISIASPEAHPQLYHRRALTNKGSQLQLEAPKKPGNYVLRYQMGGSHKIIAEVPLAVVNAGTVATTMPPTVIDTSQPTLGTKALPGDTFNPEIQALPGDTFDPGTQALPGDTFDPEIQALPGDTFNPEIQALPGDTFNPEIQALPGDTFNPETKALPGDTFNPETKALPGDTFEPESDAEAQ